jgi:hypothetical protein
MTRKRALVWLFGGWLLAVQHAGLVHALDHLGKSGAPEERLAAPEVCAKCVSFSKLTHAIDATSVASTGSTLTMVCGIGADARVVVAARTLPHNRGPPALD